MSSKLVFLANTVVVCPNTSSAAAASAVQSIFFRMLPSSFQSSEIVLLLVVDKNSLFRVATIKNSDYVKNRDQQIRKLLPIPLKLKAKDIEMLFVAIKDETTQISDEFMINSEKIQVSKWEA